jgi:hypothetical protein
MICIGVLFRILPDANPLATAGLVIITSIAAADLLNGSWRLRQTAWAQDRRPWAWNRRESRNGSFGSEVERYCQKHRWRATLFQRRQLPDFGSLLRLRVTAAGELGMVRIAQGFSATNPLIHSPSGPNV